MDITAGWGKAETPREPTLGSQVPGSREEQRAAVRADPGGASVRNAGEGPKTCYFHLLGKLTWTGVCKHMGTYSHKPSE